VVLSGGRTLDESMLTDDIAREMEDYGRTLIVGDPTKDDPAVPSREELMALLERHQGNIAAVGRELGKARMQIHRWLKRYDIDIADHRH
jgi:transcriptional regulator of acetoin/glycerol metabolism